MAELLRKGRRLCSICSCEFISETHPQSLGLALVDILLRMEHMNLFRLEIRRMGSLSGTEKASSSCISDDLSSPSYLLPAFSPCFGEANGAGGICTLFPKQRDASGILLLHVVENTNVPGVLLVVQS